MNKCKSCVVINERLDDGSTMHFLSACVRKKGHEGFCSSKMRLVLPPKFEVITRDIIWKKYLRRKKPRFIPKKK